jgi:hypothetical protein
MAEPAVHEEFARQPNPDPSRLLAVLGQRLELDSPSASQPSKELHFGPRPEYRPLPVGDTRQRSPNTTPITPPTVRGCHARRTRHEEAVVEVWLKEGGFHVRKKITLASSQSPATANHKPLPVRKGAGKGPRARRLRHPRLRL